MREELFDWMLKNLVVQVSSSKVSQGALAKWIRIDLALSTNKERLAARAAADPKGAVARLLEVTEEVDEAVPRSGSGTDFIVIAPPGCGPDSRHADALLDSSETDGRTRLVQKDKTGWWQILCSTQFTRHTAHKGGLQCEPRQDAVARVPCGCSYGSDAVRRYNGHLETECGRPEPES